MIGDLKTSLYSVLCIEWASDLDGRFGVWSFDVQRSYVTAPAEQIWPGEDLGLIRNWDE